VLTSKEEEAPVSRTEQAKRLLAQYGSAYLITSISFAIVSFAACYAAVSAGEVRGLGVVLGLRVEPPSCPLLDCYAAVSASEIGGGGAVMTLGFLSRKLQAWRAGQVCVVLCRRDTKRSPPNTLEPLKGRVSIRGGLQNLSGGTANLRGANWCLRLCDWFLRNLPGFAKPCTCADLAPPPPPAAAAAAAAVVGS